MRLSNGLIDPLALKKERVGWKKKNITQYVYVCAAAGPLLWENGKKRMGIWPNSYYFYQASKLRWAK
jgi:hypothetical protein